MLKHQLKIQNLVEISHSETLLINEAQDSLKKESNKTIYKFGFGQSPFSPPEHAVMALKTHAHEHDYLPVAGLESCRQAVASSHQWLRNESIHADDVVIAPGSKMIIFTVLACFKHANVLLPQPSWVSYSPQASLLNHSVIKVPTNFDSKWKISPQTLQSICESNGSDSPFILVLNYPGNPTGMSYSSNELNAIADVCRAHNILVISDEIYGWLHHSNEHCSIAEHYPEGTFITTGLSKWCGAGGWRFGAGIFPADASREFKQTYNGIASETYSTTAAPVQYTAADIYSDMPAMAQFIQAEQRILKTLAAEMIGIFQSTTQVKIHQPDGGFYIFPDFSEYADKLIAKGLNTCEKFCVDTLEKKGVAMLPASAFGFDDTDFYTRMCYVDFDGTRAIDGFRQNLPLNSDFFDEYCGSVVDGVRALCDYLSYL